MLTEGDNEEGDKSDGVVVEHSHSSPINIMELLEIADPVFKHITETFTTHELARQRCVNKAWKTLLNDNMLATDNSSCSFTKGSWYFPLRFEIDCSVAAGGRHEHTWTCSGVHQPSGITHSLPDIPHSLVDVPIPRNLQSSTSQLVCLALSGPLMLFGDVTRDWTPLVVYNPLTGESRELPKVDTSDQSPHVVDMVVDETTLSYKVILISRARVCTYTSSSNCWSERRFSELVTWGLDGAAKAFVAGKLHFAELEIDGQVIHDSHDMQAQGHVRVLKVDEAGTWEQCMRVALRDYFPAAVNGFDDDFTDSTTTIAPVECMGRLFAVIPAYFRVHNTVKKEILEADKVPEQAGVQTYKEYGYLPLQFYLLPLDGAGVVGQLRTRLPHHVLEAPEENRLTWSFWLLFGLRIENVSLREMQCSARGSIIYVTFSDYLLQYDLLSGASRIGMLQGFSCIDRANMVFNQPHMAYSPSFHMKP